MGNTLSSCLNPIPSHKLGRSSGPTDTDDKYEASEETIRNKVAGAPPTQLGGGRSDLLQPKTPREQEKRKTDGVIHTKTSEHDRHALQAPRSSPSSKHADRQTRINERATHEYSENLGKPRKVISVPSYCITPFGKHEDSQPRQLPPSYPKVPRPYRSTLDTSIAGGPLEPPKTPTPKASGLSSSRPAPPFRPPVRLCHREALGPSCKAVNKLPPQQCRPGQKPSGGEPEPRRSTDVSEGDTQNPEVIIDYNENIRKSLEEVLRALKDLKKLVNRARKNMNSDRCEPSLTRFPPEDQRRDQARGPSSPASDA